MKPRDEWGPVDELAYCAMIGVSIGGGLSIVLLLCYMAWNFVH